MKGYYDQVVEQLRNYGYWFLRASGGSHTIWTNGVRSQTVSKNLLSRHMANIIMKQAGIAYRF